MHRLLPIFLLLILVIFGLNLKLVKEAYRSGNLTAFVAYKLNIDRDTTTSCCSVAEIEKANGDFDENATLATFNNEIIDYPETSLAYQTSESSQTDLGDQQVLGTTAADGSEKWIEVSLDQQTVRAWEGNKVVMEFPISSGLWGRTPKGTFNIWYKTRSQSMKGGSQALGTYYNLPNVPNNMFFYQGYALHGAYWHNNFGHPMSHGCVNEPLANAAAIFDWAGPIVPAGKNVVRASADNPGTRVYIH